MIGSKYNLVGEISTKQFLEGEVNNAIKYLDPVTQEKTVDSSIELQEVIPDKNYTGLSKVTINPVTSEIDQNIKAENIKKEVSILGVLGSLEGRKEEQIKSITIDENGVVIITPDTDKVLSNVEITTAVPEKILIDKTITENGIYNASDDNVDGYRQIEVSTSGEDINEYFIRDMTNTTFTYKWTNLIKKLPDLKIGLVKMSSFFNDYPLNKLPNINFYNKVEVANNLFTGAINLRKICIPNLELAKASIVRTDGMFGWLYYLAYIDISGMDLSLVTDGSNMFTACGNNCTINDGAYDNGIPYVYVKDGINRRILLNERDKFSVPKSWNEHNIICPTVPLTELFINGRTTINVYNPGPYSIQLTVMYNKYDNAHPEQQGVIWSVISGNAIIDENGLVSISNANVDDTFIIRATSIYNSSIFKDYTIQAIYKETYYSLNLNDGEWIDSGITVDGSIVYKSDKNSYNINNGLSKAVITISGYDTFIFYIRSFAESTYDYTEAFELDVTATRGNGLYTTKGNQSNIKYKECIYKNISDGEHTIEIIYSKDSSGNTSDDRGYFYIPSQ